MLLSQIGGDSCAKGLTKCEIGGAPKRYIGRLTEHSLGQGRIIIRRVKTVGGYF